MKCPDCGREMAPGSLFCENCGYEIHMVPDYDPLDEVSIGADEEAGNSEAVKADNSVKTARKIPPKPKTAESGKRPRFGLQWKITAACVFVCVCIAAGVISYRGTVREDSYSYQLSMGEDCYEDGDYDEAASYLAKALALQGGSGDEGVEILELLSYAYAYTGEYEAAADCIREAISILESEDADTDTLYEVYKEYMEILNITDQTDLINDIIAECKDQELTYLLYDYRIAAPTANEPEGTYSYYLRIELSADYGNIYYTLDGSEPDTESTLYSQPFTIMDEGVNCLRAVAINKKGMVSSELAVNYILSFQNNTDDTAEY